MRVLETRTILGPNVFHDRPVVVVRIALDEKTDVGSDQNPAFVEALLQRLPGLHEHHCSPGRRGGFVERLRRGTYFAHIVEHIALELSELAGIGVTFGKSVYAGHPGEYIVATRFKNEAAMRFLLTSAVDLADRLFSSAPVGIDDIIAMARRLVSDTSLGPSAKALVQAAEMREIPWRRIGDGSLIELGYGCKRQRIQTAVTEQTSLIAADIAQDKALTKVILQNASLPVPRGEVATGIEDARAIFSRLRQPVAVKPLAGHHGNGVSLFIGSDADLEAAFELASREDRFVLIEEMCVGADYRVLVVKGRVVAAAERIPPQIVGDGASRVRELIDRLNSDPRRGEGHEQVLTRVEIDEVLMRCLTRQNFGLQTVLRKGEAAYLRENANLSTGGTSHDVTDLVHPSVRSLCERAARAVGLDVCGIDLIHSDIRRAVNDSTAIIEVNAGPGLRMHLAPTEGSPRDIGGIIIESLYATAEAARIPIVAITGTNGKTTVTRMIGRILSMKWPNGVGLATSDGITIGNELILEGDTTGPRSARLVLSDPVVEAVSLEVARGGLLRGGLGFDRADVAVVTNIRPDHIGQDGIEDLEDLVRIKSVLPERVRRGGAVVLNADDEQAVRLATRDRIAADGVRIVFYSLDPLNPVVADHLSRDGGAIVADNGWLVEAHGARIERLIPIPEIPATAGGRLKFQVSNAAAAAAACRSLGLEADLVRAGLRSFANGRDNRGRMDAFAIGESFVILDYAHNPDAIANVGAALQNSGRRVTSVIGLPGDRSDELIAESAALAARGFQRLVIRDDLDLRGRQPGEVPKLIRDAASRVSPGTECIVIEDGGAAIRFALETLGPSDVLVILYDDYESAFTELQSCGAVRMTSLERIFNRSSGPTQNRGPGKDMIWEESVRT